LKAASFAMNESLNRRNSLKTAGVGGAAVITIPALGAIRQETADAKLSTSSIHFMELPIGRPEKRFYGSKLPTVEYRRKS